MNSDENSEKRDLACTDDSQQLRNEDPAESTEVDDEDTGIHVEKVMIDEIAVEPEKTSLAGAADDDDEGAPETSDYIPSTMNEGFLMEQEMKAHSFRATGNIGRIETSSPEDAADAGEARRPGSFHIGGAQEGGSTGTPQEDVAVDDDQTEQSEVVPAVLTTMGPEPSTGGTPAAATAVEAHLVVDVEPPPVYDAQPLSDSRLRIEHVHFDGEMGDEEIGGGDGGDRSVASNKKDSYRRHGFRVGVLIAIIAGVAVGVSAGINSGGRKKNKEPPDATLQDYDSCSRSSECVSGACGLDSFDDTDAKFVCCPSGKTEVWLLGQAPRSFCSRHLPEGARCPMASSPSQELCQVGSCREERCSSEDVEDPTSSPGDAESPTVAPTDSPVLSPIASEPEPEVPVTIMELIPCSVPTDCDTGACALIFYQSSNQTYCCPNDSTTALAGQDEADIYCKNTIPLYSPCPSEIENSDLLCDSWQCIWEKCEIERLNGGALCQKKSDCFSQRCLDGKCVG